MPLAVERPLFVLAPVIALGCALISIAVVPFGARTYYKGVDLTQVADLNIGHYSVKAELAGFKSSEQKNVVLQVGDRDRIDFQMQVGGVQETVTVEADPVRVQTDSGEQSNVITGQQISQIAVSGRSMYQLAALVPGASSQIGAGGMSSGVVNTPVGGDAGVEFNGMRQNHNIYLLDGGEDDDRGGGGGMSIAPSSDAIAEFLGKP